MKDPAPVINHGTQKMALWLSLNHCNRFGAHSVYMKLGSLQAEVACVTAARDVLCDLPNPRALFCELVFCLTLPQMAWLGFFP